MERPAARSARTNDVEAVKARSQAWRPGKRAGSSWLPGAIGLEPADLASTRARHGSDELAVLVDDPQRRITGLDSDSFPGVAEADLDALAGDLDAATTGNLPLDSLCGWRNRLWSGQADSLQVGACSDLCAC